MKRTLSLCGAVGLVLVMLSGCTAFSPNSSNPASTAVSTGGGASEPANAGAGTAHTDTSTVMGQVTTDVSSSVSDDIGGTMTVILRDVEVSEQRMVIKFALRWDDSDRPDNEQHSFYEFSDMDSILVVDKNSLTGYRPFCTKGSWKGGTLDQIPCGYSQLVVPDLSSGHAANHALIEGYAYLPVPSGKPATLDVNIGLASFTDATVSYK